MKLESIDDIFDALSTSIDMKTGEDLMLKSQMVEFDNR